MNKLVGFRRRVSTVHPSFPISGNRGDPEAGEDLGVDGSPLGLLKQEDLPRRKMPRTYNYQSFPHLLPPLFPFR
jgi:hypothetical protein